MKYQKTPDSTLDDILKYDHTKTTLPDIVHNMALELIEIRKDNQELQQALLKCANKLLDSHIKLGYWGRQDATNNKLRKLND